MIEVTFNVITTIQDFIQIHHSVQKMHPPQKLKVRHFGVIDIAFNVITSYKISSKSTNRFKVPEGVLHTHTHTHTHTPQKFKRRPFWNGWSYQIKKCGIEVTFTATTCPPNFTKIHRSVQKLLVGDTQTGWWFDKPNFIFWVGWKWNDIVVVAHILSLLLLRRKELLHFGLHIPYNFPCRIVWSFLYAVTSISLKYTLTLKSMLFISWTLCRICLFSFIRVEGGVKFINFLRGGTSYKSLWTSALRIAHCDAGRRDTSATSPAQVFRRQYKHTVTGARAF
jgi:hypothetical protein